MGLPLSIRLLKYAPFCPHCAGTSASVRREQERLYEQVQNDMMLSGMVCRGITDSSDGSAAVEHENHGAVDDSRYVSHVGTAPADSAAAATATTPAGATATTAASTASPAPPSPLRVTAASTAAITPGASSTSLGFVEYDLPSLRRLHQTRASPFVVAPMTLHHQQQHPHQPHPSPASPSSLLLTSQHAAQAELLLAEYLACCQFYGGRHPNAGVLTTLRFSLPSLRVVGSFQDADMLALAELLLRYCNGPLRYISRLDFGMTSHHRRHAASGPAHHHHYRQAMGFRSHGALSLAKVLQQTRHVREVIVSRNRIGTYGASALFVACSQNPSIRSLHLRRCRVGERGALAFCDYCVTSPRCGLEDVDLSANYIGFRGIVAIEAAMKRRSDPTHVHHRHRSFPPASSLAAFAGDLAVNLEGNLVLQEVMNGVTHGLGVLLAFLGSYLLAERVRDASSRHRVSCLVYSTSLIVLYMSSTLYHSFFTMLHTRYIFAVIDKCAIYILIAGSYTPFLQVALRHEPLYSTHLLGFIWVCCALGIYVEAFLPAWKHKGRFSLAMYLGMGWSALVCLPDVARVVPEAAMNLMVLGGVAYTAGVPFFVRDNNLDHAVWHLFVLGGSFFHWLGIYSHVATLP
jgi:hemolysin III